MWPSLTIPAQSPNLEWGATVNIKDTDHQLSKSVAVSFTKDCCPFERAWLLVNSLGQ